MSGAHDNAFPRIAAKVDVALHCGDVIMIDQLRNHRKAINELNDLDADVKPFIAGNHTFTLDSNWCSDNVVALPYTAIA